VNEAVKIAVLDPTAAAAAVDELAGVLTDCVAGGASVSFMHPLRHDAAAAFFRGIAAAVDRREIVLLAARLADRIVGTVQLGIDMPPNQPHRADVAKLLVHRGARGRGIGARLMAAAEEAARERGRTLLVLDTAIGGDAERLYARCGWQRAGIIPGYALWPDGAPCDTAIFWKQL
jgi:GNAT superfamily N-acetyltransferase